MGNREGLEPLCKRIVSRAFSGTPAMAIREFGCRGGVTITVSVKLRENDSSGKHGPGLQIGLSDITVIGFT